jgi:hypothetical protein
MAGSHYFGLLVYLVNVIVILTSHDVVSSLLERT